MKHIFTFLFLAFSFTAFGQFEFEQRNEIKVVIGTDTLRQPWMGGLNAPVFSTIKLNNDATEDLYVFDRNTRKSYTFLADNASGTWQWKYAPEYEALFPKELEYWVLLRDFDGDGKKDLFTGNSEGTWLYKNQTATNGILNFSATPRILKFGFGTKLKFGSYNLPAISDIDLDGDLDILAFDSTTANTIIYYKNRSVEMNFGLDSLKFIRELSRWGRLNRCGSGVCNSFEFGNVTCRAAGVMHFGGASILALDLDGDTDRDILVGADMCPDLVQLINGGSTALAEMFSTGLDTIYPNNTTPARMVNYPAAYYEDVNFDGKKDLLVSPFLSDDSDNANFAQSAWLYQNNAASATSSPVFMFNKNNFLQENMVEVGRDAKPAFADLDADGDLDMLVGNYADYRTGATQYRSAVSLFTNVGSALKPVFKLTDPDYLQFSQANIKGIQLQFADMNIDGSPDLIIKYRSTGGQVGDIGYIPNAAPQNQPYSFSRSNQVLLAIDINAEDSPYFYDIDSDGDLDLLLGTEKVVPSNASGAIHYIRRVGINPANYASWQLQDNNFGKIPLITGRRNVSPVIADLNQDNQPDLITSDDSGVLRIYPNALVNLNAAFTGYSTILLNNLLATNLETNFGSKLQLAISDLNNDQKPDLVLGTNGGGLIHLENTSQLLGITNESASLKLNVFPNPAHKLLTVTSPEKIKATIYNMAGEKLLESTTGFETTQHFLISELKAGVYFLKIETRDLKSAGQRFIIVR